MNFMTVLYVRYNFLSDSAVFFSGGRLLSISYWEEKVFKSFILFSMHIADLEQFIVLSTGDAHCTHCMK